MSPVERSFWCANSIQIAANRAGRGQAELERTAGEVRDVAETLKRLAATLAAKHRGQP